MNKEFKQVVKNFCEKYKNEYYINIYNFEDMTLTLSVTTGGASGGSCWDELDDEGAVEFEGFTDEIDYYTLVNDILNLYMKEVTSDLIYEVINDILSEQEDISSYEYYGNYTDVYKITIDFRKLPEDIAFYINLAN